MSWLESGTLRCASLTTDILYYFVPWSVETLKWWSYSNKDLFFFFFFFFFLACCAWRYLKIRVLYVSIRTVWRKIKKASNVSPRWGRNPYLIVEMCSFNTLSSRKADGNNREISSKSLFFLLQPNVIYINTPWNMFLITLKCNRWTLLSFNPPPPPTVQLYQMILKGFLHGLLHSRFRLLPILTTARLASWGSTGCEPILWHFWMLRNFLYSCNSSRSWHINLWKRGSRHGQTRVFLEHLRCQ